MLYRLTFIARPTPSSLSSFNHASLKNRWIPVDRTRKVWDVLATSRNYSTSVRQKPTKILEKVPSEMTPVEYVFGGAITIFFLPFVAVAAYIVFIVTFIWCTYVWSWAEYLANRLEF